MPGAYQSRAPASAAAEVRSPLAHQKSPKSSDFGNFSMHRSPLAPPDFPFFCLARTRLSGYNSRKTEIDTSASPLRGKSGGAIIPLFSIHTIIDEVQGK